MHYVATYNPSIPGKFVCASCYMHYLEKPSTSKVGNQLSAGSHAVNSNFRTCVHAIPI